MHPVMFLFEEIYREHWGIPPREARFRRQREVPSWRRYRLARRGDARRAGDGE